MVLELGGNDGLRGLAVQQMRSNLSAIIESRRPRARACCWSACGCRRNIQLKRFSHLFPLDSKKLEQALAHRLSVIAIETKNNDDTNAIFESLNGKGRPLTQLDLLRNYEEERSKLWLGRKGAFRGHGPYQSRHDCDGRRDPRTRLPEVLSEIDRLSDVYQLPVSQTSFTRAMGTSIH